MEDDGEHSSGGLDSHLSERCITEGAIGQMIYLRSSRHEFRAYSSDDDHLYGNGLGNDQRPWWVLLWMTKDTKSDGRLAKFWTIRKRGMERFGRG